LFEAKEKEKEKEKEQEKKTGSKGYVEPGISRLDRGGFSAKPVRYKVGIQRVCHRVGSKLNWM